MKIYHIAPKAKMTGFWEFFIDEKKFATCLKCQYKQNILWGFSANISTVTYFF